MQQRKGASSCWTYNGALSLQAVSDRKKVVHAGLQGLSTKLSWTAGVERKIYYVHSLSHATVLSDAIVYVRPRFLPDAKNVYALL